MIPHIQLKRRKKGYLLIQDEHSFHIIDEDEKLKKETRTRILEGGCTPEQMQSMGLSGMTIAKADLKGVAVYGVATGDDLEFHFGRKKQGYCLAQRYEQRYLDDFFRGIPRIPTPARRKMKGGKHRDWRINEQDPEGRKIMSRVSTTLNWVSGILCAAILCLPKYFDLLSVGAILCAGFAVFLGVVHQEYFTFTNGKDYRKSGGKAKVIELWLPFFPLGVVMLRGLNLYHFFDLLQPVSYGVVVGLTVGILIVLLCRELKENIGAGFMVMFVTVFLCTGMVMQMNHMLARQEPEVYTVSITRMYVSNHRRSDDYNCVVQFPDGRELIIDVGRNAYEQYEIGDTMDILIRTGALGMEYGYFPEGD